MKLYRLAALLLALACLGCGALADSSRSFLAMDTVISISADGADSLLLDACKTEVFRLDNLMSVTKSDSDVSRLNTYGTAELSADTASVLRTALNAAQLTDGALDVTLYPVVRAWGFTTGSYRVPKEAEIYALLKRVGWKKIQLEGNTCTIPEGTMIDLGAVAKGYASDRLAAILRNGGVKSALIDLGGNVYCVGAKDDGSDWRVGIRDPEDRTALSAVVSVKDRAVVTSDAYERFFTGPDGKTYGHIFDPATGRPSESAVRRAEHRPVRDGPGKGPGLPAHAGGHRSRAHRRIRRLLGHQGPEGSLRPRRGVPGREGELDRIGSPSRQMTPGRLRRPGVFLLLAPSCHKWESEAPRQIMQWIYL